MKFKCIYNDDVYEFTNEHDIKQMLQHPEYVQIKEAEPVIKQIKKTVSKTTSEE